ncbi:MAG: ABC transporter ATP-binding protein, partial [Thermoproteota archaeon]
MTVLFISHDMASHANIDDRLSIMYAGKLVEIGTVYNIFEDPLHPYTKGLVAAIPSLEKTTVESIPGIAPSPLDWPSGCRFHPRCKYATEKCREIQPEIKEISPGRYVSCHLYG